MKMHISIFVIFCIQVAIVSASFCSKSYGQSNTDSLLKIWNDTAAPDSIRLASLDDILFNRHWAIAHTDSVRLLNEKMHALAVKKGYKKYILRSLIIQTKYPAVEQSLEVSLSRYNLYRKMAEEENDYSSLGAAYANLAIIAYQIGDKNNFLLNQRKSLESYQKINNEKMIAWQFHNLGYAYQELGNYDSAIYYYNKSYNLAEKIGYQDAKANCLAYLGESYQLKGEYSKAQTYFQLSLKFKQENNITSEVSWTKVKMGEGYLALNSSKKAAEICQEAHDSAMLTGEKDAIRYSCLCLYKSYKSLGNIKKALKYYEKWNALNDSLDKSEMTKKIQQIDFSRQLFMDSLANEKEKQNQQNAHIEEVRRGKQIRNIIIVVSLFILLFAYGLYNRLRYTKKSKAAVEKEKERSESLLLNILPSEVAEELKAKGNADAKLFDDVTVMFTDFKGFTQISEKLTPAELVAEINYCFSGFDTIIHRHGIEKIKTIGDAYMCAGGLPIANATHAEDVVQAALEIRDFMAQYNQQKMAQGGHPFEIRIGIHTGPVVAGIVGLRKFAYDIWGDTVNLASRMESHGEAGKINVSGDTYNLIKDKFSCLPRGKITTKSKGEVDMYFVENKATSIL